MNEQLRELVRERLSAAADCPAKEDIIEEITADLTEKYNELVSGGAQPEEAMEQVQAGIGDLDEVAAYINEVARRVGYDDPDYFSRLFRKVSGTTPRQYRTVMNGQ